MATSPTFLALWFSPSILKRALIVSAIVGTALVAINQGDMILAGALPPAWKIILTYMVPYSVSSFSSTMAQRAFDAQLAEKLRDSD